MPTDVGGRRSRLTDLAGATNAIVTVNGAFHRMKDPYLAFYARKIDGVVDGRQRHSTGLAYSEVRHLLESWGCDQMTNLDGGGSSVMAIDSSCGLRGRERNGRMEIMNSPSDGRERRVSEALMLLSRE